MDLRSGQAYWPLKNGLLADYPRLDGNEACEVAILGGGITGALAAYYLSQTGVNAVVLEKRDIGMGSSAASTGLLQYEVDVELSDLIGKVGEPSAVRSYRLGLEAVQILGDLLHKLGDDCGFDLQNSLYLASRKSHVKKLRREFECRKQFGFDVEYLQEADIRDRFPFTAAAAILSGGDAQVDPYRATHVLMRAAISNGARVYDRSAVASIRRSKGKMILITNEGCQVKAERLVMAVGYEAQRYLKKSLTKLHSTYALVSEPLHSFGKWTERCLVWETARPYFYLRTTNQRVLIGGQDTPFATDHNREQMINRKSSALLRRFCKMFPEIDLQVAFAWAGTFAETKDGLAYIGHTRQFPGAYLALGYGGNGITYGVIAARIISDLYLGRRNPDAVVFRFDR